jgi:hypothetical protein
MKWQAEIFQLTMAVLRRTTREITPAECATRMTTILDNVYGMGEIAEAKRILEEMKDSNDRVTP